MTTASGVQQIDALMIAAELKPIQFNVINLLNAARHILILKSSSLNTITVHVQVP